MNDSKYSHKTILFFPNQIEMHHETLRFLSKRGWSVDIAKSAKEVLYALTQKKYDCLLLSIDLPGEVVKRTAHLAEEIYKTTTIEFGEEQLHTTWAKLNESSHTHKIYGFLTGPSIERVIFKVSEKKRSQHKQLLMEKIQSRIRKALRSLEIVSLQVPGSVFIHRMLKIDFICQDEKFELLICHRQNQKIDKKFLTQLSKVFQSTLNELGFLIQDLQAYPLEVTAFEFSKWAQESSFWLESIQFDQQEYLVACLKEYTEKVELKAAPENMDYFEISLDDLHHESAYPSDVYLNLKLNKKMLLYAVKSSLIQTQQLHHLQSKGVHQLYAHKKDELLVKRFYEQILMQKRIFDYYANLTHKISGS